MTRAGTLRKTNGARVSGCGGGRGRSLRREREVGDRRVDGGVAFASHGQLRSGGRVGRADLVWPTHSGEVIVLRNVSQPSGHWLRVDLRQRTGNPFALGARVYVTAGGKTPMAEVGSGSSYLSQDELTLHFGLGDNAIVESLRIVWPDGEQEVHKDVRADQALVYTREPTAPP